MDTAFIIARNTLKIVFKKKINIFTYLILPAVMVILLVNIFGKDDSTVNVGIYNEGSKGVLAQDFIKAIDSESRYEVINLKSKEIKKSLTEQKVDCVITIPKDFDNSVYGGNVERIDIKSIKGQEATAWIRNYIGFYMRNLMEISKASKGNRDVFHRIYKGKSDLRIKSIKITDGYETKSLSQMSVGFVTMFMLMGATTVSGFILKEKRKRTYFRIFSAPVSSKVYVLGNFMAGMLMLLFQALIITVAIVGILKIDVKLTGAELFTMLGTFALVSAALGAVIVAFSENSTQSGYIATFTIVPSCMLSGCFWPVDMMPTFMQKISYFFPQRWLIQGIKNVQDSGHFVNAIPCMLVILGFAVVLFLISVFKLKISESIKSFV